MEKSEIGIFKNYPVLSILMPYYGSPPKGIDILLKLSRSIRGYLLKHYPEYRTFMFKYAQKIECDIYELSEMKIPLDLFHISAFYIYDEETADLFVDFIYNLTNKQGMYFGEHYMSDKVCIEKIYVEPEYIPILHPHIESLSSIKVFSFGGQELSLHHSFRDLIVLDHIFEYEEDKYQLNSCFFKDSELKEINPIYEYFIKIKEVYFYDYEEAFAKLNTLKQASIQEIEHIRFEKTNIKFSEDINDEDFEQITNQLLNYKIHNLNFTKYNNWERISNQKLENISKINPQKLYLSEIISISSLFRIFLHLREDINVSFGKAYESGPLTFKKTFVIIKSEDDMIKAYCDKIWFRFEKDLNQKNILFLENYVCISNFEEIHVENLKKENLTIDTLLEGLSLDDLNNESCILIPRNNLSCICLGINNFANIFENKINVTNFKSLSIKTNIVIWLSSMEHLPQLNKLKEYFPEHSELEISDIKQYNSNYVKTLLLSVLSKLKLTSLTLGCPDEDKDIIKLYLQIPSIQETLEHLYIYDLDISKSTSVFELLVKFKRIETVTIKLPFYDDEDELDECYLKIRKFERKMKKKHSHIKIIIIPYDKYDFMHYFD